MIGCVSTRNISYILQATFGDCYCCCLCRAAFLQFLSCVIAVSFSGFPKLHAVTYLRYFPLKPSSTLVGVTWVKQQKCMNVLRNKTFLFLFLRLFEI